MKIGSEWQGKLKRVVIRGVNKDWISYSNVGMDTVCKATIEYFMINYPIKVHPGYHCDISPCACMGAKEGDPFCYCVMIQKGLTTTLTDPKVSKAALEAVFKDRPDYFSEVKDGS